MVTNSIQSLQPGEGNYNFLLNAQGRIQGDCTIYREPGEGEATFLLETDKSQIEIIQTLLDKFIIMDDVELSPLSMTGVEIIGRTAWRTVFELQDREHSYLMPNLGTIGAMRRSPYREGIQVFLYQPSKESIEQTIRRVEIWSPDHQETFAYIEALRNRSKLSELSPEALEAHRILSATPKYGVDIRNTETHKDLPQETAQTHALHFNKGCYLGQEIVERIRSRGQVHRTFTAFTLTPEGESAELPTLPAPLEATIAGQTRPAGELTSAIRIGDTIHALGYLRREFATQPLTYPGGTATLKNPSL